MILAVERLVIWTTLKKGLYDDMNYFFKHQLRVMIRCDRKSLERMILRKVGKSSKSGLKKRSSVEVIFFSSSCSQLRRSESSYGTLPKES